MTAPTDFEKRLIELNLTYAEIELVKQAVEEIVIERDVPIVRSGEVMAAFIDAQNLLRRAMRKKVRG